MGPDEELLRFVRARPKTIEEALKLYMEYLEWRKGQGAPEAGADRVGPESHGDAPLCVPLGTKVRDL